MTIHKSDTKHKIKYAHYMVLQNIIFPSHLMTQVVTLHNNYNIFYIKNERMIIYIYIRVNFFFTKKDDNKISS